MLQEEGIRGRSNDVVMDDSESSYNETEVEEFKVTVINTLIHVKSTLIEFRWITNNPPL